MYHEQVPTNCSIIKQWNSCTKMQTPRGYAIFLICIIIAIKNFQNLNILPFIDHIFTVLSMPQLAIRYISDGWKS